MTSADLPITVCSFFMNELYGRGLDIVKGRPRDVAANSLYFLDGYTLMDDAIDGNGKPNYDYYIWTGLARLLISAGDLSHAGVKVTVTRPPLATSGQPLPVGDSWEFAYDLGDPGTDLTFLSLFPIETPEALYLPDDELDGTKPMGPIVGEDEYVPKLGAYPLMVNPAMGRRSTAALNFILAMALRQAGLTVKEHWIPEDTAQGAAVYLLSDGQAHYQMTYHGPILECALAAIDAAVGRLEEDGAVIVTTAPSDDADLVEGDSEAEDAADGLEPEDTDDGDIPGTGDELVAPHVDLTTADLPQ